MNVVDPKGPPVPRAPLKRTNDGTNLPGVKTVRPAMPPPLKTIRRGGARGR